MKAVLLVVASLLVAYFAIGTGTAGSTKIQDRHSQIEKVLEEAGK
ncbi:hypothetical protein [Hydrogenophaga sp.]|jgi:hypothetical protein|nr:hypothetical protein [Hydrogenophaga sp.]